MPIYPVNARPGVCRVCGCTDAYGCAEGCAWADASRTICTQCAPRPTRRLTITTTDRTGAIIDERQGIICNRCGRLTHDPAWVAANQCPRCDGNEE